jgi:hypothetical protein
MEVTISIGLLGLVTLGGMKVMKMGMNQEVDIGQDTSMMTYVKTLENQILSSSGCDVVAGKGLGDALAMPVESSPSQSRSESYPDQEAGGQTNHTNPQSSDRRTFTVNRAGNSQMNVESLEMSEIISSSDDPDAGLARITISIRRKDNDRVKKTDIFMPVYTEVVNGKKVVEGCNLSYLRIFQYVKSRVCGGSMGTNSAGMDCPSLLLMIQETAAESICTDLYGSGPVMNGAQCDLRQLHSGKQCPAGTKLRGFDANAGIICG